MTADYDPLEDTRQRSPGLEPVKVSYHRDPTPPPFVHGVDSERGRALGDAVLVRQMDPNRPDIAALVAERPLITDEARDTVSKSPPRESSFEEIKIQHIAQEVQNLVDGRTAPCGDLSFKQGRPGRPCQQHLCPRESFPPPPIDVDAKRGSTPSRHLHALRLDTTDYRCKAALSVSSPPESVAGTQFDLAPPDRPLLPALHSSPQPASIKSPDTQTLPSLQATLGDQLLAMPPPKDHTVRTTGPSPYHRSSIPGASPPLPGIDVVRERQMSGPNPSSALPLSPFSHVSPSSTSEATNASTPASQASAWRPTLKSDLQYITSPYDTSPLSSQPAQSPATGHPTPSEQIAAGSPERLPLPLPPSTSHGNAPAQSTMYTCTYPGCTAAPFQTQYLLRWVCCRQSKIACADVRPQQFPRQCSLTGTAAFLSRGGMLSRYWWKGLQAQK